MRFGFYIVFFLVANFAFSQNIVPVTDPVTKKLGRPEVFSGIIPEKIFVNTEVNFQNYSIREGLAQSQVNKIYIDKRNRIWVATHGGGVSVFNGINFTTINKLNGLSNNIVWDITEDHTGRIWIATDEGITIYDGKNFSYLNEKDSLKSPYVWCLFNDSKNRMWIGTSGGGVSVYDDGNITTYFLDDTEKGNDQIYCVEEDKKGNFWMGTHNGGLIRYDGHTFHTFKFSTKGENIIKDIIETKNGNIYGASLDGLIVVENDTAFVKKVIKEIPQTNRLYSIYEDENNILWMASMIGLLRYDGTVFFHFGTNEGLPDNFLRAITKDNWGNFWIGTVSNGLVKYRSNGFSYYTSKSGLPSENINCVFHDSKQHTWIGTQDAGLIKYDGKDYYHYNLNEKTGFIWSSITAITEDKEGNIWIGTAENGLLKHDGKTFFLYSRKQGLSSDKITAIQPMNNGEIWAGTQWALNKIGNDSVSFFQMAQGLSHFYIVSLKETHDGNLWIGTYGGGASYYDKKYFYNFNDSTGLLNNNILAIETDRYDNTWFSCFGEGICVIRSGWIPGKNKPEWMHLTSSNGLPDDAISFIHSDREWNMWIGTSKGLSFISNRNKNIFESVPEIKTFRHTEGFTGIECTSAKITEDNEKSLWIPSKKMLVRFWFKKNKDLKQPPFLIFDEIKLNMEKPDWDSLSGVTFRSINKWNNFPEELELEWYNNHLQFSFTGISYIDPGAVEYQWKMEGSDPKWSDWSKTHQITYSNLDPGKYTLKIKARSSEDVVSEELNFSFVIHPAWWQTLWFRTIGIVFFLFVIISIFRLRTRALRKRQQILEKTVTERTEEVVKQKELIEEKHREITDSINYAERIQRALMSGETILKRYVKDYFIYFNPKEAVSGDFYW
ncbi:MAG: two-component regulator propeller domain-containing protein, partial [Bacteroidota bacterium]